LNGLLKPNSISLTKQVVNSQWRFRTHDFTVLTTWPVIHLQIQNFTRIHTIMALRVKCDFLLVFPFNYDRPSNPLKYYFWSCAVIWVALIIYQWKTNATSWNTWNMNEASLIFLLNKKILLDILQKISNKLWHELRFQAIPAFSFFRNVSNVTHFHHNNACIFNCNF
jgi:hypothetical protein